MCFLVRMGLNIPAPKRWWLFWLTSAAAGLAFALDRWAKWYFVRHSTVEWPVLGDWLSIQYHINTHMALSLPLIVWLYYPLVSAVIAALLFVGYRSIHQGHWVESGIVLFILIGAASNMLDRWLYGGVIDYITVSFWSVFNLADAYIVVAIAVWLIRLWREDREERKPLLRTERNPASRE